MIHCVLHDPSDSVAVVVVEGVKAGQTLTGLILDMKLLAETSPKEYRPKLKLLVESYQEWIDREVIFEQRRYLHEQIDNLLRLRRKLLREDGCRRGYMSSRKMRAVG